MAHLASIAAATSLSRRQSILFLPTNTPSNEPFNGDWMRKHRRHTKLVLKPGTTEEISQVLKYCNENILAVVPQGGNSGLVGGVDS